MANKILFASDYQEGAHEAILSAFLKTQMEQNPGYGTDKYCASAAEKIKAACKAPDAQVAFITGGTQTNQLVIDAALQPYEGVVAAVTGHVSVHEAGAIEYTGHKVLEVPQVNGKIEAETLKAYLETFYGDANHEHMVFPGMVYISHPTEVGTLYTKAELEALHEICANYEIPLYMDGARMAYGLMSSETDVDLAVIAKNCDVFYIGGTKCGALCGEAIVYTHGNMPAHFVTRIKQHGALLAKGWVTGMQFDVLFTDDLYMKIGRHAIELADELKAALKAKGHRFFIDSPTNQQFIILENKKLAEIEDKIGYSFWEKYDEEHTVIRLCTSWATTKENLDYLISLL